MRQSRQAFLQRCIAQAENTLADFELLGPHNCTPDELQAAQQVRMRLQAALDRSRNLLIRMQTAELN